jgi:hypothetical protein|tara:strand:- start:784 stop:1086 length:303 start_codon:yes stop_codon:yes gene_type:complete
MVRIVSQEVAEDLKVAARLVFLLLLNLTQAGAVCVILKTGYLRTTLMVQLNVVVVVTLTDKTTSASVQAKENPVVPLVVRMAVSPVLKAILKAVLKEQES